MKITALKTGTFAHPIVSLPHVEIVKGEMDVDTRLATALIDCGWAEVPKSVPKSVSKSVPICTQAPEKPVKPTRKKKSKKDK